MKPKSPAIRVSIGGPNYAKIEAPLMKDSIALSRPAKLRGFAVVLREVERGLRKYQKGMWDYSPKPGTHWCIREVLWHLADSEANVYVRLRRAAAEPGALVTAWDHEKWTATGGYKKRPAALAWAVLKTLREANVGLLKILPSRAWAQKVRHPDYGVMTLDRIVGMNIWHVQHHLGQMERRYQEWNNRR